MHILLTGAFGNIGSSSLQELVRQGHHVRCFDVSTKKTRQRAQQLARHYTFETVWSDIHDAEQVRSAIQGQDIVIHLASILPPAVNENLELARAVNVDGTLNVIHAIQQLEQRPKLLFSSTLDLFGHTHHLPPPRTVDDPITVTDAYTEHKLIAETQIKESGLEWAIFRFANVPPLEARQPHPIMFEIPLDTRFEMIHTSDAGLAVANGIRNPIWGKIWLIGGGQSCQVRYSDYLNRTLQLMGIGSLPAEAFTTSPYCTDWLDTDESQALLHYQRHNFDDIMADLVKYTAPPAPVRLFMPLLAPLVRRQLLAMSPYYKKS